MRRGVWRGARRGARAVAIACVGGGFALVGSSGVWAALAVGGGLVVAVLVLLVARRPEEESPPPGPCPPPPGVSSPGPTSIRL
jgi:hypothetical protein